MSPSLEAEAIAVASSVHQDIIKEASSTDHAPLLVETSAPAVQQPKWLHNGEGRSSSTSGASSPTYEAEELPFAASTRLRLLLNRPGKMIVAPGVYDGLSARVAMNVGFDALYMTGAGTTASRLGQPDLALAQLYDMKSNADIIANLAPGTGPPLIADMDTGFGGPLNVRNSVAQYIRAGVAGFHIEDQVQIKRCGHLGGKEVVDRTTYLIRIRAAVAARAEYKSDIVIIARTDALQKHTYEECVARLKAARDLGADVGLLEGFESKEQARQCVQELAPWPLLLNMVDHGVTPLITVKEAEEMGFKIMIFSFASLAPAAEGIRQTMERIKYEGVTGTGKHLTPKVIFEVCKLSDCIRFDMEAGNQAFADGV